MADFSKATSGVQWNDPEKKAAKYLTWLATGAAGVAVFMFWGAVSAWVVAVLANTLLAMLYAGGIVALALLVSNKKVQTLVSYIGRSVFRKIAAFFVEIDPIGILKNYVEDLKKSLGMQDQQISKLGGVIQNIQGIVAKNKAEAAHSLGLAGQAQKQNKKGALILNSRKAGRLSKSNIRLEDLLKRMEALYKLLSKLRETSDIMIQDMMSEVEVKEQEHLAITAGYGAFASALKVLKGDPDKKELYEMALKSLADDYASKVGEIENFMNVSKGFIESVDLENGLFEAQALDMLGDMEKRMDEMLLGPNEKMPSLSAAHGASPAANLDADDITALFGRDRS